MGSSAKNSSTVTPTLSCNSEDVYTLKAGLITADEVIMAGGKWSTANRSYYLYSEFYWTMTPFALKVSSSDNYAQMFYVDSNGCPDGAQLKYETGLRPVINLKSDTKFSSGNGTLDTPYVVS